LAHEDEIIAAKEAEEAAARARDERLADPNWREKEQAIQSAAPTRSGDTWTCSYCNGINQGGMICVHCTMPRPGYAPESVTPTTPAASDTPAAPADDHRFDPGYVEQAPAPDLGQDDDPKSES